MATLDELLAGVSALLGKRDLSLQQFQSWLGGSVDGGTGGDGLYPLDDSTGYTHLLACPARLAASARCAIPGLFVEPPPSSDRLLMHVFDVGVSFEADFGGIAKVVGYPPGSIWVAPIYKAFAVGSVVNKIGGFTVNHDKTWAFATDSGAGVSFARGDVLYMNAPVVPDSSISDVAWSITGTYA